MATATAVTALAPPVRRPTAPETVAIIAPRSDDAGYLHALHRRGWRSVAVPAPPHRCPPGHAGTAPAGAYSAVVAHTAGLRRTVKHLRALDVRAVLAGSEQGIELTDRIARKLDLPGNAPETAHLRTDRGAQAEALRDAGIDAPRGLRTSSLRDALQWWEFGQLAHCELLPAAVGTAVDPVVCRTRRDICTAWQQVRRAAQHFAGDPHLVLREHLPGRQYVVNSVTRPGLDGQPEHLVTDMWAQTSTPHAVPARLDLVPRHGLLSRSLSRFTMRALDVLAVMCGPVSCRLVHLPGRGLVLLSARAVARSSPADEALRAATGTDRMGDALDSVLPPGPGRPAPVTNRHRVVRTLLHAPRDGTLNPYLLRTLAGLPTVVRLDDRLTPLAAVRTTTGQSTVVGEIVLSGANAADIEVAYSAIRALETAGLYEGGRR